MVIKTLDAALYFNKEVITSLASAVALTLKVLKGISKETLQDGLIWTVIKISEFESWTKINTHSKSDLMVWSLRSDLRSPRHWLIFQGWPSQVTLEHITIFIKSALIFQWSYAKMSLKSDVFGLVSPLLVANKDFVVDIQSAIGIDVLITLVNVPRL